MNTFIGQFDNSVKTLESMVEKQWQACKSSHNGLGNQTFETLRYRVAHTVSFNFKDNFVTIRSFVIDERATGWRWKHSWNPDWYVVHTEVMHYPVEDARKARLNFHRFIKTHRYRFSGVQEVTTDVHHLPAPDAPWGWEREKKRREIFKSAQS